MIKKADKPQKTKAPVLEKEFCDEITSSLQEAFRLASCFDGSEKSFERFRRLSRKVETIVNIHSDDGEYSPELEEIFAIQAGYEPLTIFQIFEDATQIYYDSIAT